MVKKVKQSNRREFLKTVGKAGALAVATTVLPPMINTARAADKGYILIGRPNPSTGPLAAFGETSPWVDDLALESINKDGGIYIKEAGKKLPVKVKVVDTQSDPTKAGEIAGKLILKDQVDLMIALHTPDTVNPVSAQCERYQVPCIALDAPVEAWLSGGPYEWSYMAFFTIDKYADMFYDAWDSVGDKHNKLIGGLWANDPDGKVISEIFKNKGKPRGYTIIDPGRFPYFTKDYSAFISEFRKGGADILTGNLLPPDWTTAWRQMHQQGYIPKVASIGKAILFPRAVEALGGNLPNGLTMEVWWSPHHPFKSSLTGQSARDFCDAWVTAAKKQWTQPLGFKHAAFELAADVLKRAASLDKEALRDALKNTDLDTIVGHVKYNDKHYSDTPLAFGQWVKGKKWPWDIEIVYNKMYPEIPQTAEMMVPIPS